MFAELRWITRGALVFAATTIVRRSIYRRSRCRCPDHLELRAEPLAGQARILLTPPSSSLAHRRAPAGGPPSLTL